MLALAERRGTALESQAHHEILSPVAEQRTVSEDGASFEAVPAERERGEGRPTKQERRAVDRLMGRK